MAILFGHEQHVVTDHQAPADVRVAGVIGLAVADPGLVHDEAPAIVRVREIVDRCPIRLKEHELMVKPSGSRELRPQRQLPPEHVECSAAKDDLAVLAGFRPILVATSNACPGDPDYPFRQIAIGDLKGDLLRLPQAGKEPKLLVVAMCRAEFGVRLGDDAFAFLDRKRFDGQAILLSDAECLQACGGIASLGMISVAEVERAAHGADYVVVGLLVPRVSRYDAGQSRVTDFFKCFCADLWPPYGIQDFPVAIERRESHVVHGDAHLAVRQVGVEDVIAGQTGGLGISRFRQPALKPVVRKLVLEGEGASFDPELDRLELYPRASQTGFGGSAPQRRAIAFAPIGERELDAIVAFRTNATRYGLSTHR